MIKTKSKRTHSTGVIALTFFGFSFFLGSCADDTLPKTSLLGKLRVLGLQASSPEVAPGSSVTLTPLISDYTSCGRTLQYSYVACPDPGTAYGVTPSCEGQTIDPANQGSGSLNPDAAKGCTQLAPAFSVTVPSTLLNLRTPTDQFNGVPFLVIYTVNSATEPNDQFVSFKRILASNHPVKNTNPSLSDLQANGVSLASVPTTETDISPVISAGAESYSLLTLNGTTQALTESLTLSWYISQGELSLQRTEDTAKNTYTPPNPIANPPLLLLVVIHDNRGGMSFKGVSAL